MEQLDYILPNSYAEYHVVKDPDDAYDYYFDFRDWLRAKTDTIESFEVEAEGVTLGATSRDSSVVAVWISGGEIDVPAKVTVTIHTAEGRDKSQTLFIRIKDK